MTRNKSLTVLALASALALGSCSGVNSHKGGGGGGNTATVLVTLTASPLTPPSSTNLLSFSVTITGVSLTPSSGGTAVNIPLNNSTYTVDLTRLQSDSVYVATSATVPTGTYSNMTVSLSNPVVTYCAQTTGASGCASGTVATATGAAAAPQITTSPFPLTLTSTQTQGLAVNLNLQNTLTVTAATQVVTAVNLGATNVLSASTLPPKASSLPTSGELSFIEDVTGVVTSVNGSTLTVKTATRGSFTATANSSTVFSPNCTNFNLSLTFASCVVLGHVASVDLLLNTTGTFTLLEYDPLATTSGDWVEGIVTASPSVNTQLQFVANDQVVSTSNSVLGTNVVIGLPINVTLSSPQPFLVDGKGFIAASTTTSFGGTSTSILEPGETVAVHTKAFTAASGSTLATITADFLFLRFTRVTGTIQSVAPPNTFNMQSFPPFFALTAPVVVQLSTGTPSTNFDGVSGPSDTNFVVGGTVSINAIYFGPSTGPTPVPTPFFAAKVRVP